MKCFPLPVEVNWSPGGDRPDIVDLPVKWAHAIRSITTECLNCSFYSISLHDHGSIHKWLKVFSGLEIFLHIMQYSRPSDYMSFMNLHNLRIDIPILRQSKLPNTWHWYHTLHAIFTVKPSNLLVIYLNISLTSPYVPLMNITKWVITRRLRCRGCGPIEPICIILLNNVSDCYFKYVCIPAEN